MPLRDPFQFNQYKYFIFYLDEVSERIFTSLRCRAQFVGYFLKTLSSFLHSSLIHATRVSFIYLKAFGVVASSFSPTGANFHLKFIRVSFIQLKVVCIVPNSFSSDLYFLLKLIRVSFIKLKVFSVVASSSSPHLFFHLELIRVSGDRQ